MELSFNLSISTKCLQCIDVACINDRFNDVVVGGLEPEKADRMILALDELSLILNKEKR